MYILGIILLLLKWIKLSFEKTEKTCWLQCVPKILTSCVCTHQIMDKLGKGSSALRDAAIFRSLQSVTLFDVCFNKHIVCFVWTWRWFTSFCLLQELLWRSLIHAFVSLHRQEPKKKKSTCIKWIPCLPWIPWVPICITCMRIITTWALNLPHHDDDVSLLDWRVDVVEPVFSLWTLQIQ